MVTLTTEYGEFQAETETDALKAALKAKREAARKQKIDSANHRTAMLRAQANGFRFYSRLTAGESMADIGWDLVRTEDRAFAPCRVELLDSLLYRLTVEGEHGRATCDYWRVHPFAYVENAAGWPMAMFVRLDDGTVQAFAIGVEGESLASVSLPGITPEQFEHPTE